MQVFKMYFKMIKQNMVGTLIYLVVFLAISILMSTGNQEKTKPEFQSVSNRIAIINHDEESTELQGLRNLLAENNQIVSLKPTLEAIEDSLFFREIQYAIIIPKGFTKAFREGTPLEITSYRVPDSYVSVYLDLMMNKYLNQLQLFEYFSEATTKELVKKVTQQMKFQTKVHVESVEQIVQAEPLDYFAKYSSYIILASVLFCVTTFMILFKEEEISKRTKCSPTKQINIDLQILCANAVIGLVIIAVLFLMGIGLYDGAMLSFKGLLYLVLMVVYTLMSIAMAILASNFAKDKSILTAIVTTATLGFGFLGGTFVPLELLGERVNFVGSFTPTFWFTKACNVVAGYSSYDSTILQPYFYSIGIIMIFALAFLTVGLVASSVKRNKAY